LGQSWLRNSIFPGAMLISVDRDIQYAGNSGNSDYSSGRVLAAHLFALS